VPSVSLCAPIRQCQVERHAGRQGHRRLGTLDRPGSHKATHGPTLGSAQGWPTGCSLQPLWACTSSTWPAAVPPSPGPWWAAQAMPSVPVGHARAVTAYRSGLTRADPVVLAGDYLGFPWTDSAAFNGRWAADRLLARGELQTAEFAPGPRISCRRDMPKERTHGHPCWVDKGRGPVRPSSDDSCRSR
jgi:hypothetical protein